MDRDATGACVLGEDAVTLSGPGSWAVLAATALLAYRALH